MLVPYPPSPWPERSPEVQNCVKRHGQLPFFDHPAEDKKVIENFFVPLRPGGFLLVDVRGKETLARDFRPRDWHEKDSALLLEEREIHTDWRPAIARKP
jgi:hypothetical protein